MAAINGSVLALDVGSKRIGIAAASLAARLPHPLETLQNDDTFFEKLEALIRQEDAVQLVVGLPRGLQGQQTGQTTFTEEFVTQLRENISLPIDYQDEAVTSEKAEAELRARGGNYEKSDVDALAATYILDDWLADHPGETG
jgi:putative Holliday junction resolvase